MRSDDEKIRHNARRRAAKKAANLGSEIAIVYEKPIEQWDDEEIARGRPRGSDGTFRGRKPKWLTPALQAERQRRHRQLMADELSTFAGDALRVLHQVLMDKSTDDDGKARVPASVRVDVGKYLVDQVMGKATAQIDVTTHEPLMDLMGAILVNPDGKPSHHVVIEGSVVDALDSDDQPTHVPPAQENGR